MTPTFLNDPKIQLSLKGADFVRDVREKPIQVAELKMNDWIVVPYEFTNGKYQESVNPARLAYSSAVREAADCLDLELEDTAKDSLDRPFVGNVNWQEAMDVADSLGVSGLTVKVANDYFRLLDEGRRGKVKVRTNSGEYLSRERLEELFSDRIESKNPPSAEWFDAYFEQREDGLYVLTENKRKGEKLDADTLMVEGIISRDSWLENPTGQGFPRTDVKEGVYILGLP